MKPGDAIRLDNWVCRSDGLYLRPGRERWVYGLDGAVHSLMTWGGVGRTHQLLAATPTSIYNVTVRRPSGSPAASVTGLSSGLWSSAMMPNSGGAFLVCCNGADGVRTFDGSTWRTSTITGVSSASLFAVTTYMRRAVFAEKNSLTLWYLDVNAIAGPAYPIFLGPMCRLGGEIVAVATQSMDGGRNANDRLVVVTSMGEVVVYAGTDPANAGSFQAAGVFQVPQPVGQRCLMPHGSDLLIATISGALPLSQVMAKPAPEKPLEALTEPIRIEYNRAALASKISPLWGGVDSSLNRLTIISIPTYSGSIQMVRSADNGGWSSFSGLNGLCWAECDNDVFFGDGNGAVHRLGGSLDNGSSISALMIDHYSRFGSSKRKKMLRVRPIFDLPAAAHVHVAMAMDQRVKFPSLATIEEPAVPWSWESIDWPLTPADWSLRKKSIVNQWRGLSGRGVSGALMIAVNAAGPLKYQGCDLMFEEGGAA